MLHIKNVCLHLEVENTARMMPPLKWTITQQTLWSDGILMRTSTCTIKTAWRVRNTHTYTQRCKKKGGSFKVLRNFPLFSTRHLSHEGPAGRQLVRTGEEATWSWFNRLSSFSQRVSHQQPNSEAPDSQPGPGPGPGPHLHQRVQPLLSRH